MAIRALQGAPLNSIQFVDVNGGLPISVKQWQMGKEWFRQAQLSWQKHVNYKQKIQFTDDVNIQYNRTDTNDLNLYITDCNGVVLHNLTSIAQKVDAPGNTYQGEQLHTHHFSFKFSNYIVNAGIYYLRMDAIYYDGVTEVDRLVKYSEPLDIRTSHELTTYIQYKYNSNVEHVIFVHPDIRPFSFAMRVEGWIGNFQPDSSSVYFKEQNYNQRVISDDTWRKFTLQMGGNKGIPPYVIDKMNTALACGQVRGGGVLLLNQVRYTKDDGAKVEVEEMGVAYPLYIARVDIREYDPVQAFTTSRGSAFLIVPAYPYPYNIQRVDFANYPAPLVVTSIEGITEIFDSADLDAFITWFNTIRAPQLGLTGVAERRGDEVWYVNGEGENFVAGIIVVNNYLMQVYYSTLLDDRVSSLNLRRGAATIFWGDGSLSLHQSSSATAILYNNTYDAAGDYTARLWHNGVVDLISNIDTGNAPVRASIVNIDGSAPFRLQSLIIRNANFSGLVSGLDLGFLAGSGIPMRELTTIDIRQSQLNGFDGTVFADNPYSGSNQWWQVLQVININGNTFSVSEINSFVNDFYDYTPHVIIGSMDLRQVPIAVATGTALTKLQDLKDSGWFILPTP